MLEWLRRLHDFRRLWRLLAALAALTIALGSLAPGSEMPATLLWDKASHFIGYAGLAALFGLAGMRLWLAFVAALLFGIAIELLQIPVDGRNGGDWADILANALGAVTAILVLIGLRRLFLRGEA